MLESHERDLQKCTYCPKMCRFACPVSAFTARETHIPQQKMALVNYHRRGLLPGDASLLDVALHCTGCLLCRSYCLHGNDVPTALIAARSQLRESEGVRHPKLEQLEADQAAVEPRLIENLRQHLPEPWRNEEAQALFITDRILLGQYPDRLPRLFEVFERLGLDSIAMSERYNYAGDLFYYESGSHARYHALIDANLEHLRGRKLIVTDSPALLHALKTHYAAKEPEIANRAKWIWEVVLEHWNKPDAPASAIKYSYHDPSYAGRYLGLYDPPRALLAKLLGAPPTELQHTREQSDTSGGFLWPMLFPKEAEDIARRRWAVYNEQKWDAPHLVVGSFESFRNFTHEIEIRPHITHLLDLVHRALA